MLWKKLVSFSKLTTTTAVTNPGFELVFGVLTTDFCTRLGGVGIFVCFVVSI